MKRRWLLVLLGSVALGALFAPASHERPASAQPPLSVVPAPGQGAITLFSGGSLDALATALNGGGCSPSTVSATPPGGGVVAYVFDAPSFANRTFTDAFPGDLPVSALFARCGAALGPPAPGAPATPGVAVSPETQILIDGVRDVLGPIIGDDGVDDVLAGLDLTGLNPAPVIQIVDRPGDFGVSTTFTAGGISTQTVGAAGADLLASSFATAPGQGEYVVLTAIVKDAPDASVDWQLGAGITKAGQPRTAPDPNGLGLSHVGTSVTLVSGGDGFGSGWFPTTGFDTNFQSVATSSFGWFEFGNPVIALFIPVAEAGPLGERIFTASLFGRRTEGQPTNDQQPAVSNLLTFLENPFDFDFTPFVPSTQPAGSCTPSPTTLCLLGGRFAATATVTNPDGSVSDGLGDLNPAGDGGVFFFLEVEGEVLLRALDGCDINGHGWLFAASTTNVDYTLTVTDRVYGATRTYDGLDPLEDTDASIRDTSAPPVPSARDPVSAGYEAGCSASSSAAARSHSASRAARRARSSPRRRASASTRSRGVRS